MSPEPLNVHHQLSELLQLRQQARQLHDRNRQILIELAAAEQARDAERHQLESRQQLQLRSRLERLAQETRTRLEQIESDAAAQRESSEDARRRQEAELRQRTDESIRELQKQLDSELWVLQSVLDEDRDDSPIAMAARAEDVFNTQHAFLAEQMERLTHRVDRAAEWLAACHASVEKHLPPPDITPSPRDQARQQAIDESHLALAMADEIDRLSLPFWIQGLRILWIPLLVIVVLTIPVTAMRADLMKFINPELNRPDWQWMGISALSAFAGVSMITIILLVTVQQKLRSRFATLMQHASNSHAAAQSWDKRSRSEIARLQKTADEWKSEAGDRRARQTNRLRQGFEHQSTAIRQESAEHTNRLDHGFQERLKAIEAAHAEQQLAAEAWKAQETGRVRTASDSELQHEIELLNGRCGEQMKSLLSEQHAVRQKWQTATGRATELARLSRQAASGTTRWPTAEHWKEPTALPDSITAGDLLVSIPAPTDQASTESTNLCLELPGLLRFPADTSLSVEHDAAGREPALDFIRALLLRLLTGIPPGRLQFTLIDPVGLGQSFSAMMHLADFDELLINSRIWTEATQIRERLQKVTEHMENIFQTYLRSQFESIEDYNRAAGEVAEPYHFVVVAGFPGGFSEESARLLTSLLTSGPRCGVHTIVAWNPDAPLPRSFDPADLKNQCQRFRVTHGHVVPVVQADVRDEFETLRPPAAAEFVKLVRQVGERSRDARRVEVSFSRIAPTPDNVWSLSTRDGIDLPIGRAGAARLQYLRLGRGTSQHVLVAGKTGSGKSTLLHILITNLALYYGPDEIQFYLIDFKKGVEFRTYAANRLPHARVVAIESDREFGLSVLERLDEVLQERGDLFRNRGVQDVPAFRRDFPAEPMPRLLLLIDEFQEFFVAEDRVSSRASLLLDRLVRQGRAFGIHVLLGSQTLGGAYSLARSTLGQVAVRIALQCSEGDAHLILSEENSAARLLTRPGEAIYNDANGLVEGNHPFQIAWLTEEKREELIHGLVRRVDATEPKAARMVVFEGSIPPAAELCEPLNQWLTQQRNPAESVRDVLPIWLGEPVAIAPATTVELRRGSGQNLLIVGQDSDMADVLLLMSALAGCATAAMTTSPAGSMPAAVTLLHDGRDRDSAGRFRDALPATDRIRLLDSHDCDRVIAELHAELVRRETEPDQADFSDRLLVIRNIGQFRSLRKDDDEFGFGGFGEARTATTASRFSDIMRRGPLAGMFVVVWSDSFSNAIRWLSSTLLREFENRIAFRMNQTDSASLIDTPSAATLTAGRAILYRDQTGTAEKFRPFRWPTSLWLQESTGRPRTGGADDFDINALTIE